MHYMGNTEERNMTIRAEEDRAENTLEEEAREPLLAVKTVTERDVEDHPNERSRQHPWMVYLSTVVAVCGSYEFGTCAGYSSPIQSAITEDLGLSTAEGALALDIGRLAGGYGMGAFSYVVPIYIAEIAPMNLRGALTTLNQVMICAGVSVSYIIGIVLTWRVLALTGLIPCALVLLGLFFVPESPRWLAKKGAQKEFEVALQKLRGKDADITHEAAEIQNYIEQLQLLPKVNILDLFKRRYRHAVIIGVGMMVIQQFGGINGICFYTSSIFESAGFSSSIGTIAYAIIQVVVTAFGATLIDKTGRKPLILVSAAGLVCGCLLAAISFYLKAHEVAIKAAPILAVTGILLYIASFSVGMGAIPWVVMSEIFPINVKGMAGSLATLVNWFGAWAVSYTFNFLMSWSSYGTFLLYAAINALAIIFVVKVVPETKGRTLEEIQAAINA
ncbi:hypothetical protein Ancab_021935 [Ancistrocladus abbreviatus]